MSITVKEFRFIVNLIVLIAVLSFLSYNAISALDDMYKARVSLPALHPEPVLGSSPAPAPQPTPVNFTVKYGKCLIDDGSRMTVDNKLVMKVVNTCHKTLLYSGFRWIDVDKDGVSYYEGFNYFPDANRVSGGTPPGRKVEATADMYPDGRLDHVKVFVEEEDE